MIKNYSISLVMPCKNEARALKSVLENLPKEVDEVIVVDNNSSDETKKVARSFGARTLSEARNDKFGVGYGFAIQKGVSETKGNIVIVMDGDGSYPVKEIPLLVRSLIHKNLDIISCNRLPFKRPQDMSSIRALGVNILNLTTWALFGYRIKDSLTGMWVFKKYAYNSLDFSEGGWNFSLEFKLKAITNPKLRFAERHISYQDRVLDLSKQKLFRTGFQHLIYLFMFKLNLLPKLTYKNVYAKISESKDEN